MKLKGDLKIMACFIVPTTEAVVTTAITLCLKSKEKKEGKTEFDIKTPFSRKLSWLNKLLWGGSALLAFEHVWHGEVIPSFPFLSAALNPADFTGMIHEMLTSGVAMSVLATTVWAVMLFVLKIAESKEKKANISEG